VGARDQERKARVEELHDVEVTCSDVDKYHHGEPTSYPRSLAWWQLWGLLVVVVPSMG
jgi:hypothetical protein